MTSLRDELELRQLWLDEWPGHATMVEPSLGSTNGAPDAMLVARFFPPAWVEFKALDLNGFFKLEPSQRLWMRDFIRYSSRCAIVAMSREGFYTIPIWEVLKERLSSYQASALPSIAMPVLWKNAHMVDLPKILELVYVSSK